MKVLVVSYSDSVGGAAIAARRAFSAVGEVMSGLNAGDSIKMMVCEKKTDDQDVITTGNYLTNTIRFVIERGTFVIYERDKASRFRFSMNIVGTDITRTREFREADIIHLHWTNNGFLSFPTIRKILNSGKKVIWTLHDMWTMTGGCHHAVDCRGYLGRCGNCPLMAHPHTKDLSAIQLARKSRLYTSAQHLTMVPVSEWLAEAAAESSLISKLPRRVIPNPIDTLFYVPKDKLSSRCRLEIPTDKFYIAFGAANVGNPKKGIFHLLEAIRIYIDKFPDMQNKIGLLTFGKLNQTLDVPIAHHHLGYITDKEDLKSIYGAADIFALPSLEDTLPNTVMESLSSGRPVLGFATGGIPYMVGHLETGYLAPTGDSTALAEGIEWFIGKNMSVIGQRCRDFATSHYSAAAVGRQLYELYKA